MNSYENVAVLSGLGDVPTDGTNTQTYGPSPEGYYTDWTGKRVFYAPEEQIVGQNNEPIPYPPTLSERLKDIWSGVMLGKPGYVAGAAIGAAALGTGLWFLFHHGTQKVTVMSGYTPARRKRRKSRKSRRKSRR